MKYIKQTILMLLAITTIIACNEDDPFTGISVTAPSNLQMNIQSDANQVGLVSISSLLPKEHHILNLTMATVLPEDRLDVGQSATHQYAEGTFNINWYCIQRYGRFYTSYAIIDCSI